MKAKDKMSAFELDDVRDVSAGAATFYLWVWKYDININTSDNMYIQLQILKFRCPTNFNVCF